MSGNGRHADDDLVGRTLCDIAQTLESPLDAQERVEAALALLGKVVPYHQCVLLEAEAGRDPQVILLPAMPPEMTNELTASLVRLFGKLIQERALPHELAASVSGPSLAVPLIGLDQVIGLLFVRLDQGTYKKRHLRVLSLVATQLAAYLMMLRGRAEEIGRARELAEARRAVDAAHRAKDQLVNLLAHELGTPLAGALAWLRVLASPELSAEERAGAVRTIERSVRTQARIIGDLVDLTSLAIGDLRLELSAVEPAGSLQAAIEGLRPLAKDRSIRLEAAFDPSVRPVWADSGRLEEVFSILLANAFELTPEGGTIHVRLEAAEAAVRIKVADGGKGFGAVEPQRRFEAMRSRGSATDRGAGARIGLQIARHVIELHGGSLRAESRGDGLGTTLAVELPADR